MREEQRRLGGKSSSVMEGRDIGTVVFPDAQIKIFLDAAPQERARRRAEELGASADQVEREIGRRDQRDRERAEAPLTKAPDAEYVDTSGLTPEQVEEAILKLVRKRTSN
jgi:cytidylate kinase